MWRRTKAILVTAALLAAGVIAPTAGEAAGTSGTGSAAPAFMAGVELPCWYAQSFDALSVIKSDGYKTVDLEWNSTLSAKTLDTYLAKCDALGLAPKVSMCDAKGKSDTASFKTCVGYLTDPTVAGVLNRHTVTSVEVASGWNPGSLYLWLNTYNEFLPTVYSALDSNVSIDVPNCGQSAEDTVACCAMIQRPQLPKVAYIDIGWILFTNQSIDYFDLQMMAMELRAKGYDIVLGYYRGESFPIWPARMAAATDGPISSASDLTDQKVADFCKAQQIAIYPLIWCGDSTGLNLTSDWVKYTPRGIYFSDLLLG